MAATLRLPEDLNQKLSQHCAEVGATKHKVIILALREHLAGPAPRSRMLAGARALVEDLAERGLSAEQVAAVLGIDLDRLLEDKL